MALTQRHLSTTRAALPPGATAQPAPGGVRPPSPTLPRQPEPAPTGPALAAATDLSGLLPRAVAMQVAAESAPAAPRPAAATSYEPPTVPLPRWAVQVLAGPALTYRQLNSPAALFASLPARSLAAANVAELEHPALSGGAQVQVRRTLTEHWWLSAGLGYAEYATRLALRQVSAPVSTRSQPANYYSLDSATTRIYRRDTYRFVTVPLRVGYAWPLAPRWRAGLLAGADVAVYAGGRSTEGSACACQTQPWGFANNPYRRVSVGLSLGAEARYRLNGRWELLAQPTATYLLNSLSPTTSAYARRHLLGGTALLGAAYTLP